MFSVFRYSGFGLCIASDIELHGLPAGLGDPDIQIRRVPVPRLTGKANETEQYMFNTLSGHFLMRGGREILVEPLKGVAPELLQAVLLGRAMAHLLRQRGWLPLHASAVEREGEAALFVGPSGAGKSTMLAALTSRGGRMLTDDVAAVRMRDGRCHVLASWPHARLTRDSLHVIPQALEHRFDGEKYVVPLRHVSSNVPIPVRGMFLLAFGPSLSLTNVNPCEAAALLSHHSFVKTQWLEDGSLRKHFEQCAQIAAQTGMRHIVRRRSFAEIENCAELVEGSMCW